MLNHGEQRLQRLVVERVRPDCRLVAFDVGARIGDWSRRIIESPPARGKGYEIHAFEPVPDSRSKIQAAFPQAIERGELRVHPIALSDTAGSAHIYVPHFTAGTSTLHPDTALRYEQVIEVATSTLDEFCSTHAISHIDLVKVDTEGHDLRVIRGAEGMLREGRIGVLQFEYNHRWIYARSFLKDAFDLTFGMPYRVVKVCASALEMYAEWHPELERFFETNYALVHEKLTDILDCMPLRIGRTNACDEVPSEVGTPAARTESLGTG